MGSENIMEAVLHMISIWNAKKPPLHNKTETNFEEETEKKKMRGGETLQKGEKSNCIWITGKVILEITVEKHFPLSISK